MKFNPFLETIIGSRKFSRIYRKNNNITELENYISELEKNNNTKKTARELLENLKLQKDRENLYLHIEHPSVGTNATIQYENMQHGKNEHHTRNLFYNGNQQAAYAHHIYETPVKVQEKFNTPPNPLPLPYSLNKELKKTFKRKMLFRFLNIFRKKSRKNK